MLPTNWRPVETADLVRVGPAADGGYVIPEAILQNTDVLVGMGISDNWGFEADFKARTNCEVVCYDHTIGLEFWAVRFAREVMVLLSGVGSFKKQLRRIVKYVEYRRFFNKKTATHNLIKIGYDVPGSTSIASIVKQHAGKKVFLKIDIEGWEYRVLDQIADHSDTVTGFVVEFHDIDLHRDRLNSFIESLKGYNLVHIHPNNFGGVDLNGDPIVVEMTFVRDDFLRTRSVASKPNTQLDYPNDPRISELQLTFS